MELRTLHYTVRFDEQSGSLVSLAGKGREFIAPGGASRPCFKLRLRGNGGSALDIDALQASRMSIARDGLAEGAAAGTTDGAAEGAAFETIRIRFEQVGHEHIDAEVAVRCYLGLPRLEWHIRVDNGTDYRIEWIDFPDITVPNDLVGKGGDATILWPAMEGVLIEDLDMREQSWLRYQEPGYPSKGWEGIYPGPCPTQFMAYYGPRGGLYVAAHDPTSEVKSIEPAKLGEEAIRLQYRLFPGAPGRGSYELGYPMVTELFAGDWHDAAQLYRDWFESSTARKAVPLEANPAAPSWIGESPVIVTYPVRGEQDTGDMSPNEYFPYVNALPHLGKLAEELDSKIMALLMHWEGTAPWAPPYVWPPYGGTEAFKAFADGLHAEGNLLGVYASGIGWTNESLLDPAYTRKQQLEEEGLIKVMCASPEGDVPHSLICNGTQRWGYDMCPATPFAQQTVLGEIASLIEHDCDYIQFFDQNLGGLSYFCYSHEHGHPPAPGKWQAEAMRDIYSQARKLVEQSGKEVAIGCEAAAAEPFIPDLLFNDMRFNITFMFGKPVPAYQYVYHKYINNFMGNQNMTMKMIDGARSPYNLQYRLAYSFSAGDMLTIVLGKEGSINWDWGTAWDEEMPAQQQAASLIRTLNGWRKGIARPFLCYGDMRKPDTALVQESVAMHYLNGREVGYPAVLASSWSYGAGRIAHLFVNYTDREQQVAWVPGTGREDGSATLYMEASGAQSQLLACEPGTPVELAIPPLSVWMIEQRESQQK